MKVHLPSYPPGVHTISESLDPSDLGLDEQLFGENIQAKLVLDRHDPYLEFDFDLRACVRLECDLCLTAYDAEVNVCSPMLYVLGNRTTVPDVDDPEIVYVPAGTTDLDISTDLRDFLILALPRRNLCREDCRGLCPHCGTDLNMQLCTCGAS
ncbi:DUF177 domain-containing protein [bacterium]|nr:DUF177 domain-containing protein [bacterium]MBU1983803.1 DUF177 domain-containing protein [bacterium]